MSRFSLSPALLLALAPLAGTAYAADPEFTVALVTESREYERQQASGSIAGVQLHGDWKSLRDVLDRNVSAQQMPEMFTFGLLAEFDVAQIAQLVAPRPVAAAR